MNAAHWYRNWYPEIRMVLILLAMATGAVLLFDTPIEAAATSAVAGMGSYIAIALYRDEVETAGER